MAKSIILGLIAGFAGLMLLIGPSLGAGTQSYRSISSYY